MNLQTIHEHTIDVDLLTGGVCIDAGCRGFQFSEAMRDLGCRVIALDVEPMKSPHDILFVQHALMHNDGQYYVRDTKDQQAKYVTNLKADFLVEGISLDTLCKVYVHADELVDVLKLDIESAEYFILPTIRPIPRQISVEFHEHCFPGLHGAAYESCMRQLEKFYIPVQHERYKAHGAGWNYWDSLFIRKDLIKEPL